MADVQKVSSGIPGLDDLIEGGFWPKSTIVILGSSGTGKSTFAIQFLMEGIEQGEQALYVTLEEPPEQIMREADRKSTRLNSSHSQISYAVFCLQNKKTCS